MAWTYRSEYVRCGKKGCHCASGTPHGPYWYRYQKQSGKLRKEYVGKGDPRDSGSKESDTHKTPHPWDAIFNSGSASSKLAFEILRVPEYSTREETAKAFRLRSMEAHPDRGGSELEQKHVNAAWGFLRWLKRW